MIGLVDCNNFYASCERLFRPDLQHTPIVVLSNNDGCIVARSQEVKALNLPMATPYFQAKAMIKQHKIKVFSSNYQLYGSISARIMRTLASTCPTIDIYSIDEAFIYPTAVQQKSLLAFGTAVKNKIFQWVGMPVCVGFAETKTLAKIANHIAKKQTTNGVFIIDNSNKKQIMYTLPIQEVWGIGKKSAEKLKRVGIQTGLDLMNANDDTVRKAIGINGIRTAQELRGIHALLEEPVHSKSISSSKSFSRPISNLPELKEALSCYVETAHRKLREKKLHANGISIYFKTNFNNKKIPQYANLAAAQLEEDQSLGCLIKIAVNLLETIYRPGFAFIKVGVILSDLTNGPTQPTLFSVTKSVEKSNKLQDAMNKIESHFGKNTIFHAVQGTSRSWSMKQDHISPNYTTQWQDIPVINI